MTPRSLHVRLGTGIDYHALEWDPGPQARHTVILVHGFLDHAWGWSRVVEAGLGHLHVVAPDMRGHGDSGRVGHGGYYHFADYLADLDDLATVVARDRLSLVGHSMGGSITSYFAGAWPERVSRLALLEGLGPPETGPASPERIRSWVGAWRRARDTKLRGFATVEEAAERMRKHDPLCPPDEALRLARLGTVSGGAGVQFKHDPVHLTPGPQGFQLAIARSFWSAVTCPVLLVDGARSEFVGAGEAMAERRAAFRDARHVVLPDAGHMMMRHVPGPLGALLGDFLR